MRSALAGLPAATNRRLRRLADRLGRTGLIGAALAATCVGYFAGSVQPLRTQIAEMRAADARTGRAPVAPPPGQDDRDRLRGFVSAFPDAHELPRLLESLYEMAQRSGIHLAQGEYRLQTADALGIANYRITLPVTGAYPRVRKFLALSLAEIPGVALTHLNLQRERIAEGQIDARVELTLYLRANEPSYARPSDDLERVSEAAEHSR